MVETSQKSVEELLLEYDMKGIKHFIHSINFSCIKNQAVLDFLVSFDRIYINGKNIKYIVPVSKIKEMCNEPSKYKNFKWSVNADNGLDLTYCVLSSVFLNINERDSDIKSYKKYIEENICIKQLELNHLNEVLNKLNTFQ